MKLDYDSWIKAVNGWVNALSGLDIADLPDWNYRDAFEDGVSAKSAAKSAIKAAKSDGDF